MTDHSLRDFIKRLEERKLLHRVAVPVSTELEMTEIHRRILAKEGPALLFDNVVTEHGPSSMPVLTNLFGTKERIALGLGAEKIEDLREIGKLLAFLKQPDPSIGFKAMMPLISKVLAMKPRQVKSAPCQEIVWQGEEIDLTKLPIQTCWPGEPAPLITWPLVVTQGARLEDRTDDYNLGIYRMQVIGRNKTVMRWLHHRGGAQHHAKWQKEKKPMPVAAVIGADPATILAAVMPIPDNVSEYQFAGLLRGKKLELVPCKTIPLAVPAQAEIVLEGYVSLDEYYDEGPYGDHTGYYNSIEKFPIFTITSIPMREKPIYLTTYTGKPPDEPSVLGEALNEIFIPLLQQQFPEIVDFWLPPEGCSYRIAVISIKKLYAGHAKRIMMGAWSFLRQFIYTKFIIIVDDDINCRDWKEVMWAISTRADPVRDVTLIENTPIDYLDFASPEASMGGKMGIDATNKIIPETKREWGKKIYMKQDVIDLVTAKWASYDLDGL